MATKTVNPTELNKQLMEMYKLFYGVPHTHKAFREQGASLKAIATAVGVSNVLATFEYLLMLPDDAKTGWLQPHKNIPGLVRFFDAIQTMRLNDTKKKSASLSAMDRAREVKEATRLARFRKEMFG